MTTNHILFIFAANILFIFGVYKLFDSLLINIKKPFENTWLSYPTFNCPPCMSTIWGNLVYWIAIGTSVSLWVWPFYWLALCGANYLIIEWLNKDGK